MIANTVERQDNLAALDTHALSQGCQDQKADGSHARYCLELFRRAVSDHDQNCWQLLYETYKGLLCHWVLKYAAFVGYEVVNPEPLAADTLSAFWSSYTADKLAQAEGLSGVLSYLRTCAATAVKQEIRREDLLAWQQQTMPVGQNGESAALAVEEPETEVARQMEAQRLWEIVRQVCRDDNDLLLAEMSLSLGMKPSEIMERYPNTFASVEEVYAGLRNLRNRLRRNENLRELWTKND